MSFSTIRTLVTGGSGFIGLAYLCESLLAEGREVLCVDNYYTGRRQNIDHLLANPRFEVMRHDITLRGHLLRRGWTKFINLAWPGILSCITNSDPARR